MIAAARVEQGLAAGELARKAELTLRQLKRYESGADRILASELLRVAAVLEVPVSYFFGAMGVAECVGLDGSKSDTIGPENCARVIDVFRQFQTAASFDAAISMARSLVTMETLLRPAEPNPGPVLPVGVSPV
ncbi:MAG: helix-turn-helix domain-containing protein [Alphaproteobacteria bacterium]|nr:helix-turn-helix domain-containing protein [Alphaproteobacteria bacterium]